MKDAFIFETEAENSYPQGEYSYEDFEGDFEGDYEADFEGDYESDFEGDYEADFEGDYESDYEGDYEAEDFEDQEYADLEMADEFRGRRLIAAGRPPVAFRPARRFAPSRASRRAAPSRRFAGRTPFGVRPSAYRYRRPYRWRPGMRRFPPGFSGGVQPGFGGGAQPGFGGSPVEGPGSPAEPSNLVMLLQRLLNRTVGASLPVDGVMSVETRSALRSFQSQPDTPPNASAPPPPPGGGPVADAAPPQSEYDELAYFESEFDEFGY